MFTGLNLSLTPASQNTILDYLNLGYTVTFPRDPVTWGGLTRDPLLVVDPVTGDNGLFLVAPGYADNLVSGSEVLLTTPHLTVPELLAVTAPATPPVLCQTAADWLTVLPDSTISTGIAYLPAIAHIKNFLLASGATGVEPPSAGASGTGGGGAGAGSGSNTGGPGGTSSPGGGTGAAPLYLSSLKVAAAAIALIGRIDQISAQPAIVNVQSGPHTFSPNGDNVQDTFNLVAACPKTASWTVRFSDAQGNEVRGLDPSDNLAPDTGNASVVNLAWDGRDDLGTVLPDGRYGYTLAATGTGGTASVSNVVVLDTTPPQALLSVILRTSGGNTAFAFTGTASDANFESYMVDVVDAGTGAKIQTLFSGNMPVSGTFGAIPSTVLPNGAYRAELGVLDKAGNFATAQTAGFTVNNAIPDTTPPAITVTSALTDPNAGTHSGTVPVTVTATDAGGIASIELLLDGATVAQTTSNTLNYALDCSSLSDGPHTLYAVAADNAGNLAETESYIFLTSSPISGFAVTPTVATQSQPALTISATLKQAAAWTLSFTGPAAIPVITGTGTTISGQLNGTAYADGDYTVTLQVTGLSETPQRGFIINLVDFPPVADIALDAGPVLADGSLPAVRVTEGLLDLAGTADDPDADDEVAWRVRLFDLDGLPVTDLTPPPVDASGFRVGRAPAGSRLATLDFTLVRNGVYVLRLDVRGGNATASDEVRIALDSQLKVGQFSFAQQDIVIPVSGMPITVIRTYNSLNPTGSTDFGPGWTFAVNEMAIEIDEDRASVQDVDGEAFSMRTGGGRDLTLDLPDGRRTTFTFGLERATYGYRAKWTPAPGVYATLVPTCSDYLTTLPFLAPYWDAAGMDTPWENFDFPGFILTMKDGTRYEIGREDIGGHFLDDGAFVQAWGRPVLKSITDRAGNTVRLSRDAQGTLAAVEHYNATGVKTKSIVFQRNAQGRVIALHDPAGLDANGQPTGPAAYTYDYDAQGRLIKASKLTEKGGAGVPPAYQTVEFKYENAAFPHYVTSILDPRGITPMRTEYDDSGRIVATIDAYGNRIDLHHDLAAKTETVYDRLGNPTIHVYDSHGNVTETIDAQGNRTSRTYDAAGNELTVTDALGHTTNSTYDASGNRTSVTDAMGHTSSYTHDHYGNQLSVTDPLGNVTHNDYDGSGNLLSTTNALGQTTRNTYANGNLTETRNAVGQLTASFGYDTSGNMTTTTSFGVTRWFDYDANGNQTSTSTTVDGQPLTTSTTYDAAGNVVASTDALHHTSTTVYNELGKPYKTTDTLGNTNFTEYDARGNVIETRSYQGDPSAGNAVLTGIVRTVYDANGRAVVSVDRDLAGLDPANAATAPATLIFPRGSRTICDSIGRVVRTERLANVTISLAENPAGSGVMVAVFVPAGSSVISSSSSRYDAAGRVIESISASGGISRYEYDVAGRQTAVITLVPAEVVGDPPVEVSPVEYDYDEAGRQIAVTNALGHTTQFEYDSLGRRVRTIFPDGTTTLTTYDQLGRRIAETDQAGVTKDFEYDQQGHLAAVELPAVPDPEHNNTPTRPRHDYGYDLYGRLMTITDPKDRQISFSYDKFSRQLSRTLPATVEHPNRTEHTEYDDYGRVAKQIDFKGQVTAFSYDAQGWVTERRHYPDANPATPPARTYAIAYDELGRQQTITRQDGTNPPAVTSYSYDQDGRIAAVSSPQGTITYDYDDFGRKTQSVTPGSDTRFSYDELGRLVAVSVYKRGGELLTQPEVTTYAYTETGARESQVLPNGLATLYTYDALSRLTNLSHFDISGGTLASFTYTLAPTGRRTGVQEQLKVAGTLRATTITYSYDQLNRLTNETSVSDEAERNFAAGYSYDLVGNRLAKSTTRNQDGLPETTTYAYNAGDQLASEASSIQANGTTAYTWDVNGSMTGKANVATGESATYTYNLENRLSAAGIQRRDKDHQGTYHNVAIGATYDYDVSGIRCRSDSSTTIQGSGTTSTARTFLIDHNNPTGYAQIADEYDNTALRKSYIIGDDILSQTVGGTVSWLSYDAHGSTRLLANSAGEVTSTFSHDAWGVNLFPANAVQQPASDLLFAGESFSSDLQMLQLRARDYNQSVGAFASLDPLGGNNQDPQSLHKYTMANNDPVNRTDPTGAFSLTESMVVTAVVQTYFTLVLDTGARILQGARALFGTADEVNRLLMAKEVVDTIETVLFIIALGALVVRGGMRLGRMLARFRTSPSQTPTTTYSPFAIRIHPGGKGPMAVDTSLFTTGDKTPNGGIRNSRQFWKKWKELYPETLSNTNKTLIDGNVAPEVDEVWSQHFPHHRNQPGEVLVHHHLDQGAMAIPIPESVHASQPGWGIFHPDMAGNGFVEKYLVVESW
ncbi:MAG: hypothetical protein A3K18_24040 [Lentisphaerae bacterium RIFOXYA12_64_32]|nr:MAG: hypothetical protein A3K18_24040 [Lentisphaerae bacterium RIFOXYA12_64_32]